MISMKELTKSLEKHMSSEKQRRRRSFSSNTSNKGIIF